MNMEKQRKTRVLGLVLLVASAAVLPATMIVLGLRGQEKAGEVKAAAARKPVTFTPAPAPTLPPAPIAREPQPWESRKDDPPPPEGHVAAWKMHPPRPTMDVVPLPPAPRTVPDPMAVPSLHNPGGVNGDRPARVARR
jgi:hypothetical protein